MHRNGLPIKRRIIAAGLAAVGLMAGTGGVHGEPAPLAAVDLAAAEKGVLLDAELSPRPAAGRYRLVLPLALKPLRDPAIGNLAVSVEAGGSRAVFQRWEFEAPARMQEFAVEFVADGDVPPRLRVNWEIDAAARLYRVKATPLPRTPAETAVAGAAEDTGPKPGTDPETEADKELLAETLADEKTPAAKLAELHLVLAAGAPRLEPLPPLAVLAARPDKVLYRPGETGTVTVAVRNFSNAPQAGELFVTVGQDLGATAEIMRREVRLDAKANASFEIPLRAEGRWGHMITATVAQGGADATLRDWFSVSDDLWEVGIGHAQPIMTGRNDPSSELVPQLRAKYSNWVDLFFWAPCDWAQLVSPLPEWWSGQADYHHKETNLKAFVANCHAVGIRVAAYASSNPAGPYGWEAARRHPEWFFRSPAGGFQGSYNVEHLDRWNDPGWRAPHGARMGETDWYHVPVDLRRTDALDFGIAQLVASARHYGWDAVRFDGHYTITGNDALSTRNMRRLKETVWAELPGFRFGFNYGRAPEWRTGVTHEMREAMAGGGLYMQEGIRNWRYTGESYTSWSHYAAHESEVAAVIRGMGGHYHCIWELGSASLTPAQRFYKLAYGLIAGGHPAYGSHAAAPGSENWGAFLTQASQLLWDGNLETVGSPARVAAMADRSVPVQTFVRQLVLSPSRRLVVMHLVNPPTTDAIAEGDLPARLPGLLDVVFRPAAGESVRRAILLTPEAPPFSRGIAVAAEGDGVRAVVPGLRLWGMVVWDVAGAYEPPPPRPRFTEAPDAQALAAAEADLATAPTQITVDPNKPPEELAAAADGQVWETDSGFSGHGIRTIASDADATGGLAQMRDLGEDPGTYPFMGRPFIGPVQPGRYQVVFRLRREAADPKAATQLFLRVHHDQLDRDLTTAHAVTPDYVNPAGGPRLTLAPPGEYHDYPLEIDLRESAHISADLWPAGPQGDCQVYLDHIRLRPLERYTDRTMEAWVKVGKPMGLRTPQGQAPGSGLLVRGLFWQPYGVEGAPGVTWKAVYRLPATHEEAYAADVIVMANVDFSRSDLRTRRILRDWVLDGGRLVVLGGSETLGQGGVPNTYIEELLPVRLKGAFEVVRCEPPLELGLGKAAPDAARPALFWRHDVPPADDAQVMVWAGEHPVGLWHTVGKGRVYVFAGTVLGTGDGACIPFWETPFWAGLIERMAVK